MMGVEYRHYLIPKPNDFLPKPDAISKFIEAAAAGNWLPSTKPEGQSRGDDRILTWRIDRGISVAYPLAPVGIPPAERYFEIQIQSSSDFVYRISECIDPFDSTACACGAELETSDDDDLFFLSRLRSSCPECRKAFDPSDLLAAYRHPMTGEESLVMGGATSRFAIVIDCGKCVPSETEVVSAVPRFLELCQTELRSPFYEVGDVY